MKKSTIVAIGLALVLVVVGAAGCGDYFGDEASAVSQDISSQQDIGIWVTGVGKVEVAPDVAVLNVGVEAQAATVAEAQQQADEAMNGIMGVLDNHNIDEKDIKTQQYSIQPVREWQDEQYTLIGYRVVNTITVKVRNIDDTGSIIDDAVSAGGDNIVINNISFTVDEPENYYEDARADAMADAKEKAKQLADLGGVNLGDPIFISEYSANTSGTVYYDVVLEAGDAIKATASISPGETEIQITVQVVFAIK